MIFASRMKSTRLIISLSCKKVLLVLITQWSTMKFQRYTKFVYYFGNIRIPMLRKREQIKDYIIFFHKINRVWTILMTFSLCLLELKIIADQSYWFEVWLRSLKLEVKTVNKLFLKLKWILKNDKLCWLFLQCFYLCFNMPFLVI